MTDIQLMKILKDNAEEIRKLLGLDDKDALIALLIKALLERPAVVPTPYPIYPDYVPPAIPYPPWGDWSPLIHWYTIEHETNDSESAASIKCGFELSDWVGIHFK